MPLGLSCLRLVPCLVPGLDTSLEGIKGKCRTQGSQENQGVISKVLGDQKKANPPRDSDHD